MLNKPSVTGPANAGESRNSSFNMKVKEDNEDYRILSVGF